MIKVFFLLPYSLYPAKLLCKVAKTIELEARQYVIVTVSIVALVLKLQTRHLKSFRNSTIERNDAEDGAVSLFARQDRLCLSENLNKKMTSLSNWFNGPRNF